MPLLRVFRYLQELDAFAVTEEYRRVAERLGLVEWSPVVWIGRLFFLDNDYGEHWFDNWDEREALEEKAQRAGISSDELLIVVPDRFKDGADGPCHPAEIRKLFWTDVLKSLEISYDLLYAKAREANAQIKDVLPADFIPDLEERISQIAASLVSREEENDATSV